MVADAQHANPEYANELARLATRHGAIWRTEDFDVPLDELLRRNEARPRADHVPEEYIRSSWKRFPPRDVPPAQSRRPERQPA
ncbi:MAG: AAA family ATPase [Bifidobacterium bifidum]